MTGALWPDGAHLTARDLDALIVYTILRPGSDLDFGGEAS